jgi:hypothetical protein
MTPEETVKPKRVQKPKESHPCYISNKCRDSFRDTVRESVCPDFKTFKHIDNKNYCILHLPTKEKNKEDFNRELQTLIADIDNYVTKIEADFPKDKDKQAELDIRGIYYDFRYVWFPTHIDLHKREFRTSVYFNFATFSSEISFDESTFTSEVSFKSAVFSSETSFNSATFLSSLNLSYATFEEKSQIFFIKTKFDGTINFNYTNINGFVAFEGNHSNRVFIGENVLLDLQNARIDDAKKISFHTVRLEPSWFVNVNASEFAFTDCKWRYADGKKQINVKSEINHLRDRQLSDNPNELLTKACWQLADNHEESKSLGKASMFRKFANESKRLATPWYLRLFTLHWWYYAVSFYGESWRRALVVLFVILFGFGLLFESPWASFEPTGKSITESATETKEVYKMNNGEGIVHSLSVATFQRPEPKAHDTLTKLFVVLEIILAPLQAASLALAIRRKFMR